MSATKPTEASPAYACSEGSQLSGNLRRRGRVGESAPTGSARVPENELPPGDLVGAGAGNRSNRRDVRLQLRFELVRRLLSLNKLTHSGLKTGLDRCDIFFCFRHVQTVSSRPLGAACEGVTMSLGR